MPWAPSLLYLDRSHRLSGSIIGLAGRLPLPVITLPVPIQFIHEEDVVQAFLLRIVGVGASGVYNITGDGVLSGAQVLGELSLTPIPAPAPVPIANMRHCRPAFRPGVRRLGGVDHPAVMDASKAKRELGWRPPVQQPRGAARHAERSAERPLPEDREAPLLGEPIHSVLDRGFDLAVDRVGVIAIVARSGSLRLRVDRVEQLGAISRAAEGGSEWSRSSSRRGSRARSAARYREACVSAPRCGRGRSRSIGPQIGRSCNRRRHWPQAIGTPERIAWRTKPLRPPRTA